MNKNTPWAYRKGATLLHRLPAGYKLVFLLVLSVSVFFPGTETRSITILACIIILLVILSLLSGINPFDLLRGSFPLFMVIIAVFLLRGLEFSPPGFNSEGLKESIIFCFRIGTAFAAGSLLFTVTTPGEIRKSLSRLEVFLHLEKLKLSLSISLMLLFLPRFFEVWEDLNLTWKSRGGKNSFSRLVILVPIAVERMMIKAAQNAEAMEARGAE